ncbi:hypothetical protein TNCV_1756681 [Trichonephila clavipes]|nr:hypothetical protein TNCV_1756681 [Trichonephila clavipes]
MESLHFHRPGANSKLGNSGLPSVYWEKSAVGFRPLKRGRLYCEPLSKRLVTENQGAFSGAVISHQIFCKACLHAEIVEVEIEVASPSIVPSGNFAELNRTVTCMVLKANDRRTSCPCHDEFRRPRSDYVRQVALENNNNKKTFYIYTQYEQF